MKPTSAPSTRSMLMVCTSSAGVSLMLATGANRWSANVAAAAGEIAATASRQATQRTPPTRSSRSPSASLVHASRRDYGGGTDRIGTFRGMRRDGGNGARARRPPTLRARETLGTQAAEHLDRGGRRARSRGRHRLARAPGRVGVQDRSRGRRNARLLAVGARTGGDLAVHRARRVFADAARPTSSTVRSSCARRRRSSRPSAR